MCPQPETNGFRFADMAADPTVVGEILRSGDTIQALKIFLAGAVQTVMVKALLAALDCNIVFTGAQTVDGRDVSVDGAKLDTIQLAASVETPASVTMTDAITWYDLASKAVTVLANTTQYFLISGMFRTTIGATPEYLYIRLLKDAVVIGGAEYGEYATNMQTMHITTVYAIVNATAAPVTYTLKVQGYCGLAGKDADFINLSVVRTGTVAL